MFKKDYRKLNDEQLMVCIQRGDTSAFNELYDRYSQRLLFYFYRALGSDNDKAQDFLQETFLRVIEKHHVFRPQNKFSSWIFTMANNLCKNEYRRLSVRKHVDHDVDIETVAVNPTNGSQSPGTAVDLKTFERLLYRELEKMSSGHRSTFLLRYQQNLPVKQISEILECSEGTVKSRLFYTVRKLASELKAFDPYNAEVCKNEKTE